MLSVIKQLFGFYITIIEAVLNVSSEMFEEDTVYARLQTLVKVLNRLCHWAFDEGRSRSSAVWFEVPRSLVAFIKLNTEVLCLQIILPSAT